MLLEFPFKNLYLSNKVENAATEHKLEKKAIGDCT